VEKPDLRHSDYGALLRTAVYLLHIRLDAGVSELQSCVFLFIMRSAVLTQLKSYGPKACMYQVAYASTVPLRRVTKNANNLDSSNVTPLGDVCGS